MQHYFSEAAKGLQWQPMFKILWKVQELEKQGENIIHFEIWDPDFQTPNNIIEKTCKALKDWETHYTNSFGIKKFRESICKVTEKSRWFTPSIEQVLVTPWANISIYYAISCLANPWDEVLIPDPWFPTYTSVLSFCQVKAIKIPLKEESLFRISPEDIKKNITKKTKLIILNSPQNPTGSILTKKEIVEIYKIALDNNIYIYSDEIYSRMIYDKENDFFSPSMIDQCKEITIVANGFSKAFAMTWWRLWTIIWPEALVKKMQLLLETTSSCVTPFIQYWGLEAIEWDQATVESMVQEYKKRRDILFDLINNLPWVSCIKPDWAFYIFANIQKTGMSDVEFAEFTLQKAKVAILPWSNFWEYWKWYVRFCYANSIENIREGLRRMKWELSKLDL